MIFTIHFGVFSPYFGNTHHFGDKVINPDRGLYIYRAICKDSLLKVGWVFPQCKEMGVSKPLTSILLAACKTIDIFKPATWARQCVKG